MFTPEAEMFLQICLLQVEAGVGTKRISGDGKINICCLKL